MLEEIKERLQDTKKNYEETIATTMGNITFWDSQNMRKKRIEDMEWLIKEVTRLRIGIVKCQK